MLKLGASTAIVKHFPLSSYRARNSYVQWTLNSVYRHFSVPVDEMKIIKRTQ